MNSRVSFSPLTRTGAWWMLWILSGSCAAQAGAATTEEQAISPNKSVSCDDILLYETADAHPDIRWIAPREGVSANAALGCILGSQADDGTIELAAYMSSGLYRFVRDCKSEEKSTYRLFEYKYRSRPYLLRLHKDPFVDPKTYVVVASHRRPAGNYQHQIAEMNNNASKLRFCPADA